MFIKARYHGNGKSYFWWPSQNRFTRGFWISLSTVFFFNRFSLQIQCALTSTTWTMLSLKKSDQVRSYIVFFSIGQGVAILIYCKRFIVATLVTSRTADSCKLCYLSCSLHSGGLVSGPADTKSYPGIIWKPIRYVTFHFQDQRGALSLSQGRFQLPCNFSVRTHVNFTRVNKIETLYGRPRVKVKVESR